MFPTHPQVAGSSLLPFLYGIPLCARIFSTSDLRLVSSFGYYCCEYSYLHLLVDVCSGEFTPRGGIAGLRGAWWRAPVSRVLVGYIPHIQRRVLSVPHLPLILSFPFGGGCIDFVVILISVPLLTNEDEGLLLLDRVILNIL